MTTKRHLTGPEYISYLGEKIKRLELRAMLTDDKKEADRLERKASAFKAIQNRVKKIEQCKVEGRAETASFGDYKERSPEDDH